MGCLYLSHAHGVKEDEKVGCVLVLFLREVCMPGDTLPETDCRPYGSTGLALKS